MVEYAKFDRISLMSFLSANRAQFIENALCAVNLGGATAAPKTIIMTAAEIAKTQDRALMTVLISIGKSYQGGFPSQDAALNRTGHKKEPGQTTSQALQPNPQTNLYEQSDMNLAGLFRKWFIRQGHFWLWGRITFVVYVIIHIISCVLICIIDLFCC